jgi:hypothetical protein
MKSGENDFLLAGMPLEKKYRQVQGLQSQNCCKKVNSQDGKAGIFVKMTVYKFFLPKFPEIRRLQSCEKPYFQKSGFAMMQHVSGKKIRACATSHTPFSAEFWQSGIFEGHFF